MSPPLNRHAPWFWGCEAGLGLLDGFQPLNTLRVRAAFRSLETEAEPDALFLWLCQLRRAPYSYDWVDNFGRRSPREPDPAMTDLGVGQSFMTIFTLIDYDPGRSLTLRMNRGWPTGAFGAITVHYRIEQVAEARSRLSATLLMPSPHGPLGEVRRYLLAWGDLFMMRKQLRTLSILASKTARIANVPTSTVERRP